MALKWLLHLFEGNPLVERAMLPGVDLTMMVIGRDTAQRTIVVGITHDDVTRFFDEQRPVPPDSLLRAVGSLLRLGPATLVVDIFTEDPRYREHAIPSSTVPIVWAQSADTTLGALLPVLGGRTDVLHTSALAALLAEHDGLVRRIRLRFQPADSAGADSSRSTLPYAAVNACRAAMLSARRERPCMLAANVPSDTSSVALRSYIREPPFYTLGDALAAATGSAQSEFQGQIMVLGFADGSDEIATPFGIRPGPVVVADAIETLMDDAGLIRRPPFLLGLTLDALAVLLVVATQYSLKGKPYLSALSTLVLTVGGYVGARAIMMAFNYWTSFLPMMVGVWAEQLLEQHREATKQAHGALSLGTQPAVAAQAPAAAAAPAAPLPEAAATAVAVRADTVTADQKPPGAP